MQAATPALSQCSYEACPDDGTFHHLASLYATTHRRMAKPDNPVRGWVGDGGWVDGRVWMGWVGGWAGECCRAVPWW